MKRVSPATPPLVTILRLLFIGRGHTTNVIHHQPRGDYHRCSTESSVRGGRIVEGV
jgi:hypothetical protein